MTVITRLILLSILLFYHAGIAQDKEQDAKRLLDEGQFENAVAIYENLYKNAPRRTDYLEGLVFGYQQLERYTAAEKLLAKALKSPSVFPTLLVEMGQNHRLQGQQNEADAYFNQALKRLEENTNFGYALGARFQKFGLLDWAIKTYKKGLQLNPDLNFGFQLARAYGEQGEMNLMFRAYLQLLEDGKSSQSNVLRNIEDFIQNTPEADNNQLLKNLLLERAQQNPILLWNELLSWLFVKQGQLNQAFVQERAIFKREGEVSFSRLMNLGYHAHSKANLEVAIKCFDLIIAKSKRAETVLEASLQRIAIDVTQAKNMGDYEDIEKRFENLLSQYKGVQNALELKVAYARFLCFDRDKPQEAIKLLEDSLETAYDDFSEANLKITLGDVLLYNEQFNRALILFTQVQQALKNDVLAQEARFKVAKASFFKGDFDWALTQLKVLRSSTSQLTANDAMQLSLLISDNILEDSTQTALKKYAQAELLLFQNKTNQSIAVLDELLLNHKGETIEDEALLKHAQLMLAKGEYSIAAQDYQKIIEFFDDGILIDDAHFGLAELFEKYLDNPEKAKYHYEQIIFLYQDSFYFPEARQRYRSLRGDVLN